MEIGDWGLEIGDWGLETIVGKTATLDSLLACAWPY